MATQLHPIDQLANVTDRLRTVWLGLNASGGISEDFLASVSNVLSDALMDLDVARHAFEEDERFRSPTSTKAPAPTSQCDALTDAANEVDCRLAHIGTLLDAIDDLHDDLKGAVALGKLEGLLSIIKDQRTSAVADVAKIFAASPKALAKPTTTK